MIKTSRCPVCGQEVSSEFSNGVCADCALDLLDSGDSPEGGELISAQSSASTVDARLDVAGQFGDYQILQKLGHGGMGVVYKAHQLSLNRVVAVKMILSGKFASESQVLRFRSEAEAIAHLDHPNIVPIYEVGQHQGRHFFSMRLIEGSTLAAEIANLTTDRRAAVRLLIPVTRAVHYAHQHGILHRDLKPANILLDAGLTPYVSDFGLAKQLEDEQEATQTGALLGTPSYMSPEQAAGKIHQLTTAADVYSLGAILYELLTCRPPFKGDSSLATLKLVQEAAPTKPSAINPRIDRDIETICLKCLEKDAERRYSSALALAEDLEAWLAGRPISARPVGPIPRLWRWCRREPLAAGLAAAVIVAVVAGTAATTWQTSQASVARAISKKDKEQAQRRSDELKQAMRFMSAFNDRIADLPGSVSARKALLDTSMAYFSRMADEAAGDASLRYELAIVYRKTGDIQGHPWKNNLGETAAALVSYQKAIALLEPMVGGDPPNIDAELEMMTCRHGLARIHMEMGNAVKMLETLEPAIVAGQRLIKLPGVRALVIDGLAESYAAKAGADLMLGHKAEALANCRRAVELEKIRPLADPANPANERFIMLNLSRLGDVQARAGDFSGARSSHEKMVQIAVKLAKSKPDDITAQLDLKNMQIQKGILLAEIGRHAEARSSFHEAVAILERFVTKYYDVTYKRDLAECLERVAEMDVLLGEHQKALNGYEKSLKIGQELSDNEPTSVRAKRDLSVTYERMGDAQETLGQNEKALESFNQLYDIRNRLVETDSTNTQALRDLSVALERLGDIHLKLNNSAAALPPYRRMLDIRTRLAKGAPGNTQAQIEWATAHRRIGDVMAATNQFDPAMVNYQQSLDIIGPLAASAPARDSIHLLVTYDRIAEMYVHQAAGAPTTAARKTAWKKARITYQLSIGIAEKMRDANPGNGVAAAAIRDFQANIKKCDEALAALPPTPPATRPSTRPNPLLLLASLCRF